LAQILNFGILVVAHPQLRRQLLYPAELRIHNAQLYFIITF